MKNHISDELLVIKVGTSTLTKPDSVDWLALDHFSFREIGQQVVQLADAGTNVAIVSSAAIAAGYACSREERTTEARKDTLEKQRMACLGQASLMHAWQTSLQPKLTGQVLFTRHELNSPEKNELRDVTQRLFERGDIPVANENDALSHEEISFGDNDMLAAHFTALLHGSGLFKRSRLVILSDIDGLYEDRRDPSSVIRLVNNIDDYQHLAGDAGSANGTGGMASKFKAVRIANQSGIEVYLANGRTTNAIQKTLDGEIGTKFAV